MANIALVNITNEWVKLETAIADIVDNFTFDTSKTYQLQFRGNAGALLFESDTAPEADTNDGFILGQVSEPIEYKAVDGVDLYIKAQTSGVINVAEKGE